MKHLLKLNYNSKKNFSSKIFKSSKEAVADIKSGSSLLTGGFGLSGIPENLLRALSERKEVKDLHIISNNGGIQGYGNGLLIEGGQVKKLTGSYVGENKILEKKYFTGELELNLIPQGTLAEKIRSGGAGIPAFYTPTGHGTMVSEGGFTTLLDSKGNSVKINGKKPTAIFNGKNYVLEESITSDYALVKALVADTEGNLIFRKTARNFNEDMATAGKIVIAEVEEIVEKGELDPDKIHTQGIFVHRIIKGERYDRKIERLRKIEEEGKQDPLKGKIARRAAEELENGMYVNLGIGIPNLVTDYLPKEKSVIIHTENGMLGVGPYPYGKEDADLISAIKEPVSELKGCSYFGSSKSFGMVRGNHVDITILGAFQISERGDLANWIVPGKIVKGMGGAMDLVSSGGKVIVTMEHVAKGNEIKLMEKCSYPITGKEVVSMVITDLAVFKFNNNREMILTDIFKGVSLEQIKKFTGGKFKTSENIRQLDY